MTQTGREAQRNLQTRALDSPPALWQVLEPIFAQKECPLMRLSTHSLILVIALCPLAVANALPMASGGDITGTPSIIRVGEVVSITADYTDADGAADLVECRLRLGHPTNDLTLFYNVAGGFASAPGQGNFVSPILVNSTAISNGLRLTWNFHTKGDWPRASGIDFQVSATDSDGASAWSSDGSSVEHADPLFGTTVITHGFQLLATEQPEWMTTMGIAIANRLGRGEVLQYDPATGTFTTVASVGDVSTQDHERIFLLDWVAESDINQPGFSEAAADAFVAALLNAQLADPSEPFLDRIHLIGHSRGPVVMSEMAERFGALAAGGELADRLGAVFAIDPDIQVTALDPNTKGYLTYDFQDDAINLPEIGRGVVNWSNIGPSQNYWQNRNFLGLDVTGEFVPGSRNRNLDASADLLSHSEIHAWYHGTIDLEATTDELMAMVIEEEINTESIILGRPLTRAEREELTSERTRLFTISRSQWYQDDLGITEGYGHLPQGGEVPYDNSVEPLDNTPAETPRVDPVADAPHNGDFEVWSSGDSSVGPGWQAHGGGGGAVESNGQLRLAGLGLIETSRARRIHNRFFIPSRSETLSLDFRIVTADPGTPPNADRFEVRLGNSVILGGPGEEIWLTNTSANFTTLTASLPALSDPVQTLTLEIVRGGAVIEAEVLVDNIRLGGGGQIITLPDAETFPQSVFGETAIGEQFIHDQLQNATTAANVNRVLATGLTGTALADIVVGELGNAEPDSGLLPAASQADALEAAILTVYFNSLVPSSYVTPINLGWVLNADPINTSSGVIVPPDNAALAALADAGTTVLDVVLIGVTAVQLTGGNETPELSGTLNGVPITVQDLIDVLDLINASYDGGEPSGAVIP